LPTHSSSSSYHHHYSTNNQDDEQTNETSSSPSLSNSPLTTTTTNNNTTPTITNINAKKSTVSQQHLNNHNRLLENQNIINSFDYKEQQQQQQHQNINLSHQNQQLQQQVLANNFSNLKIATSLANSCKAMDDFSSTQSQRKIGSIADYDPLNYEKRGMGPMPNSISSNTLPDSYASLQQQQQQQQQQQKNQQAYYAANSNANNFNFNDIQTSVFKAIYDYDAKEDDEISFRDGDKFTNCEQIDVGWMIGIHYSTGKHGMFPSNYVEPVDLF